MALPKTPLPGMVVRYSFLRVAPALRQLSDEDIDRMIKEVHSEVEPLLG